MAMVIIIIAMRVINFKANLLEIIALILNLCLKINYINFN